MKKNCFKLSTLLLSAMFCMLMAACGDDEKKDDPTPEDIDKPITPVEPTKESAMSVTEQKEYLEKVAFEFMDQMPSSDFNDLADLGMYIHKNYSQTYDWSTVEKWARDVFDASRQAVGQPTTETEKYEGYGYTNIYNYIYTDYKSLLLASNMKGHFTARNGRWVQEKADDLQFVFEDKRGQQCVLKLETSGSVKKVHVFGIEDTKEYDWSANGNVYTDNRYIDRTQVTIGVPETIVVTLTQGGSQVVKTTVKIDLGSLTGEEFDISKDNLTASVQVELNNGYRFDVSQVTYTANKSVSVIFTMSKSGQSLVSVSISGDVSNLPSVNVSAFSQKNFDRDDYSFDKVNVKNAFAKIDIIGKVQIQGTVSDIRKFADYISDADKNVDTESTFKSYINQANALIDFNLFYDGKSTKQAAVKFEPFVDGTWNGRTWWRAEPVLNFYDGSSYSTFEAFFNEKDFQKVIDTFKDLAKKYAYLIDEQISW